MHQSSAEDETYLEGVESGGDDTIEVKLLQEVDACSGQRERAGQVLVEGRPTVE